MDSTLCTAPAMLRHWATTSPDTTAFIFVDAKGGRFALTHADVFRLSSRYAAILRRQGVKQGTRVCNTLPNSPERLLTDMGVMMAGGVAMNSQMFLSDGEDLFLSLEKSAAFAVIVDPEQPKGAAHFIKKRESLNPKTGQVKYADLPALQHVLEVHSPEDDTGRRPFIELLEKEQESYVAGSLTPRDKAAIWTTSGSTGFSKLVPVSHQQVLTLGHNLYNCLGMKPGDILFNHWPMGWTVGFPVVYLARGITRVIPDHAKEMPADTTGVNWDAIESQKCTVAFLVPFDVQKMMSLLARRGVDPETNYKVRVIMVAGQPITLNQMDALGFITESFQIIYGITETQIVSTKRINRREEHEDHCNGKPSSGVQIRIVDKDFQDLPVGKMGEILVKSPTVFGGYVDKEATKQAFTKDGWYKSGDLGYLNTKGEVFTVCRVANSIMRGSYTLYPGWLERRLMQCPGVHNVFIVPVPDPVFYQEICACVMRTAGSQLTSEEVIEFCKKLYLLPEEDEMTAVPKHVLFFDAFPTTSTGKICRRSTAVLARSGWVWTALPSTPENFTDLIGCQVDLQTPLS